MKFKIIFSLIFIAALGVLAYFAYPIFKIRYFENNSTEKTEEQKTNKATATDDIKNKESDAAQEDSDLNEEAKTGTDETGVSANITAEDCDNECGNFKDSANDLKYCQDICGLSPTKDSENCESKSGSDKDYCFKNQAVAKTEIGICDSISDPKIKSSCKNRVTEDMLENQP
jgi:hypothetical protein